MGHLAGPEWVRLCPHVRRTCLCPFVYHAQGLAHSSHRPYSEPQHCGSCLRRLRIYPCRTRQCSEPVAVHALEHIDHNLDRRHPSPRHGGCRRESEIVLGLQTVHKGDREDSG